MRWPDSGADRNALAMAGLRIAVGCLFLIFGQYKVFGIQFTLHGGFETWINRFLQNGEAYPFMVPVLQGFVLPHATAIAFLVAYGELAIGLALILGTLVRTARAFGPTCFRCCSRRITQARTLRSGNTSEPRSIIRYSPFAFSPSLSAKAMSVYPLGSSWPGIAFLELRIKRE